MTWRAWLARPSGWFAAACATLVLILVAEWLPGGPPPSVPLSAARPAQPAAAAPAGDAGESDGGKDVDSWAETITARPLFAVSRRPPKSQGPGAALTTAGMPRLSGIVVTRASRRAIFMPDGGKPLVLAEGASLDDATIRRITTDRVYLSGPKGDQVVFPTFDHNRVPPPPIVPNPPPFQPNGPGSFRPIYPPGGAPQPPPDTADDDSNDDTANAVQLPQPPRPGPIPAMPGGFRSPMFHPGRPQE